MRKSFTSFVLLCECIGIIVAPQGDSSWWHLCALYSKVAFPSSTLTCCRVYGPNTYFFPNSTANPAKNSQKFIFWYNRQWYSTMTSKVKTAFSVPGMNLICENVWIKLIVVVQWFLFCKVWTLFIYYIVDNCILILFPLILNVSLFRYNYTYLVCIFDVLTPEESSSIILDPYNSLKHTLRDKKFSTSPSVVCISRFHTNGRKIRLGTWKKIIRENSILFVCDLYVCTSKYI